MPSHKFDRSYRTLVPDQVEQAGTPDAQDLKSIPSIIPSMVSGNMADSKPSVNWYLLYLVFIATIGPLHFGYHLGELNAPQKVITCQANKLHHVLEFLPVPQCILMNPSQWGLVQSIFTIGGLLGSLLAGPIATKYGRLFGMRAITLPLFIGPLAEGLAPNILTMGTGRFISGIGSGAATVICPIYIAEISPAEKRGHFGAFTQVMINGGILIAQLSGYFLSEDNYWRIILIQAATIAAFEFCGLIIAPETPKWLAENNRPAMGRRVLQKIRGREANIQAEMENWEWSGEPEEESLLGPQRGERPEKQPAASMLDVLRIPRYRKAVIAVTAAMMAQQLTGINSVVMYSVTILGAIIPSAAALVTVLVSAINILITALCAPLADKIGRKACLLISIAGMGSNSVLLAIGLSFDYPFLSVLATFLFVCSFGVGLGPIPFILASELVDSEAVGAISSWALAGNWLSTFCVAQFFPMLNNALPRGKVYWGFAAVALIFGVFIAWWLPESMGRANVEEVWAAHEGRFQDVQDLEPEVEDLQDEA